MKPRISLRQSLQDPNLLARRIVGRQLEAMAHATHRRNGRAAL